MFGFARQSPTLCTGTANDSADSVCVPIAFPSLFSCVCVNSSSNCCNNNNISSSDNQIVSWRTKEEEEEEEALWSKASCEPFCRSVCVLTKCIINDCLYCLSAGAGDDDDDDCYNEDYRGNATGTDGEGICCQQTLPNTHTHFHRHIPLISTLHTHTHGFISPVFQLAVSTPFLWPGRNSSSSEFHCNENEMKTDTLAFAPAVRLGTLLEHIKFVWHTYCQAYSTVSDSFCIIRRVADILAPLSPPSHPHSLSLSIILFVGSSSSSSSSSKSH